MLVALMRDLLWRWHQRLGLAEVEDRVAMVMLLHDPGDDVTFAPGVFAEGQIALGLAQPLKNDLFGRLCRDAPEVCGGVLPLLEYGHLFGFFVDLDVLRKDRHLAGLRIDFGARATSLVRVDHPKVRRCE